MVGGAWNFYYDKNGVKNVYVDGVGNFRCNAETNDRLAVLKMQHKSDRWSAAQYAEVLLAEGLLWN